MATQIDYFWLITVQITVDYRLITISYKDVYLFVYFVYLARSNKKSFNEIKKQFDFL